MLGSKVAEQVCSLHIADFVSSFDKFRYKFVARFNCFEFESANRPILRKHKESSAESVAANAA